MKRLTLLTIIAVFAVASAWAQNLILHYDFSQVNGKTVADMSPSGANATLAGSAKVDKMGKYSVLNLGTASGYLDMGSAAGGVFKSHDALTISMYYKVLDASSLSGNGFFLWSFSTSSACTNNAGKYSAYRLNAQRVATSSGGYGNELGIQTGKEANKGVWEHVAFVQTANGTGYLYINGKQVGSTAMHVNSTNFGSATVGYNWIGRPPFSGDNYLSGTLVADVRLYDDALSAAAVQELAALTEDLEYESRYGGGGDFTALQTAVESAETYLESLDKSLYPAAALLEYEDAINMAKFLIAEGLANQTTIDDYRTALTTARTKLNATKGKTLDISSITTDYDTNRGFIHPGGMYTQADFDRVKQQLADGNPVVKAAHQKLLNDPYSQATTQTWPPEVVVRGGGVGENYINACRGAAIAYQNALRWKIDGTKANADNAVRTLMAWCNTTKVITGSTDAALAFGLYGYEFAQAAELMRDYEGWSREDFHKFQRWMLDLWYPGSIGFLRHRNGTWENAGKWWQAPGHYWSNWGLCNALAVLSIGVLCDDVFIYNQGLSFIKYDQVGTFKDPRTADPILNDGLTEFWGNLIVTTYESPLETGAYGKLGQMNESGRDAGHAAMAAGLAVDIAQQVYSQGDDLYAFMDHRLAAGIEYLAAQTQEIEGLPWVNYHYANNGFYYSDARSWLMTGPALGAHIRPYWGTVIGHYEGIKGVKMPFSELAYKAMGEDWGGVGGTSGGYDHLGYSILMNTRDGIAPADKVPTELSGKMTYNGKTVSGNELGGLKNNYQYIAKQGFTAGTAVTLQPQLPEGEEDTGKWLWNTGETTRDITITTDRSQVYRVTYTNKNGITSQQAFTIAVDGDCQPSAVLPYVNGVQTATANVTFGSSVVLSVSGLGGFGAIQWENGQTTSEITIPCITSSRDISVVFTSQGGRRNLVTFHLNVQNLVPNISVGNVLHTNVSSLLVEEGKDVVLNPTPAGAMREGTFRWLIDGVEVGTDATYDLPRISNSQFVDVEYYVNDDKMASLRYEILVHPKSDIVIENGNYLIRHRATDTYLTNTEGAEAQPSLQAFRAGAHVEDGQVWCISHSSGARYDIISLADSLYLNTTGDLISRTYRTQRITVAAGTDYVQFYNASNTYWDVNADGTIVYGGLTELTDFPFQIIPVDETTGIQQTTNNAAANTSVFDLTGRKVSTNNLSKGIYIVGGNKVIVK